ncbi:MAG: GNAT family N-acetyltransferase [Actinomycetota bacterium]
MIPREPTETDWLRLEPIEPTHAERTWEAVEASLADLRDWMAWAPETSRDRTEAFVQGAVKAWSAGREYDFAILQEGSVVGGIGIRWSRPDQRIGEMGYWVRSDVTGRGYATEAGRAIVGFGFRTLGLYRLELRAGVENAASQRVAEKLGFHREGTLRSGCPHGSGGYDCHLYGLLASDVPHLS